MSRPPLGIIGGSGFYSLPGFEATDRLDVDTPFGKPSSPLVRGELGGRPVVFLARHGRGHLFSPSTLPFRANIFALKLLGVERILAVSACGSLREDIHPCHLVAPDQLWDLTRRRISTFFDASVVAHISFADPFCLALADQIETAAKDLSIPLHRGGAYVCIEGPQLSTRAESRVYRSMGMSVIGMTAAQEAKLAREAEMCFGLVAAVTDYDVWHEGEEVTVERVVENMGKNRLSLERLLARLIETVPDASPCECRNALAGAIISDTSAANPRDLEALAPLLQRYIHGR